MKGSIKKLIKEDNFLSLAGNLVIAVLGFAGFALLARSYKPEVFGEWVIFISSGSFIEMFRFGITNTAVIRYLSGANYESRVQLIGSNWVIGLVATTLICLVLIACNLLFKESIQLAGYGLFFTWYPMLAFINLPYNTALVILQADQRFDKILWIKAIYSGGFFAILFVNYIFLNLSLTHLVIANIGVSLFASAICLLWRLDGFAYIFKATIQKIKILLDFGKYTTFTLIGTNLLRSADTLIISLSPLGTAAVALYSIPLKLTEIQQIPLRSFAATAFPKMSKASIQGKIDEIKSLFYVYSGAMTYLFVFISFVTFVFAELFVLVLGGSQYIGIDPSTGFNTVLIVRIFSIYGLLLPIDRMTGIGLDAINSPDKNAIKVFIMVLFNVIGDLIAVFLFKSLALVAVGSICFTLIGVWVGYYFLDKQLDLSFSKIFSEGVSFYSGMRSKLKKGKSE